MGTKTTAHFPASRVSSILECICPANDGTRVSDVEPCDRISLATKAPLCHMLTLLTLLTCENTRDKKLRTNLEYVMEANYMCRPLCEFASQGKPRFVESTTLKQGSVNWFGKPPERLYHSGSPTNLANHPATFCECWW